MRSLGLGLLLCAALCAAVPIPKEKGHQKKEEPVTGAPLSPERRAEYQRYLDELMTELGGDPELKKELEKLSPDELAKLMELPGGHKDERTLEEEEWRDEVDEQRRLQRHRFDKENDFDERPDGLHLDELPEDNAEIERMLQEQNQKMENTEKRHHDDFVKFEMEREYERRQKLKSLSEKDRLEADEKHQAEVAKARDHPKVHHPGSEQQLRQEWEDEGFDPDSFNVETFFHMQDHNQDGQLDAGEVEGMLVNEVEKIHHDPASAEYHEELLRMRQHVVHEVDKNRDGLLSMEEFLASTKLKSFANDDSWKGLDYDDDYTDEEYEEYERLMEEQRRQHETQMQGGDAGVPHDMLPEHQQPVADGNVQPQHAIPQPGDHEQQQQQHEQPPHHEQQQQQQHHEQQQPPHHEQQQQQQPPHHEQQQQHHEQQQPPHHEQQQQQPPHHEQQQQQPPHHEQ
eukprot:scpid77674/ scgid20295/ Nucleobindin-1